MGTGIPGQESRMNILETIIFYVVGYVIIAVDRINKLVRRL